MTSSVVSGLSVLEIIKYLVEHDANINLQTNNGYSALHIAVYKHNILEIITILIFSITLCTQISRSIS